MVEPIFDYQFRLILIGDSTVGKSSLLKYFTDGKFTEVCDPTVGVDFYARLLEVKPGIRVKLQLWDTAGQERFRYVISNFHYTDGHNWNLLEQQLDTKSSFSPFLFWPQLISYLDIVSKIGHIVVSYKTRKSIPHCVCI